MQSKRGATQHDKLSTRSCSREKTIALGCPNEIVPPQTRAEAGCIRDKSLLPAMPAAPQPGSPKHSAHTALWKTHFGSQQVVPELFTWSLPATAPRGSRTEQGGLTLLCSLTSPVSRAGRLCGHRSSQRLCLCQHKKVFSPHTWLLTTAAGLPARPTSTPEA